MANTFSDFEMQEDVSMTLIVAIVTESGALYGSLADFDFEWTVKSSRSQDATAIITKTSAAGITVNNTLSEVRIALDPADTRDFVGTWLHELRSERLSDGAISRWLGIMNIKAVSGSDG